MGGARVESSRSMIRRARTGWRRGWHVREAQAATAARLPRRGPGDPGEVSLKEGPSVLDGRDRPRWGNVARCRTGPVAIGVAPCKI